MSTYLFFKIYYLCFVLLCCTLCVPVCSFSSAQGESSEVKEVNLFKDEIDKIITPDCTSTTSAKITVKNVKKYFLVFAGGFMTALVSADICDGENGKYDLLTKYFETKETQDWGKEAINNINQKDKWITQLASKLTEKDNDNFPKGGFAAVVKKNEIYYISVNVTEKNAQLSESQNNEELIVNIVKSKINNDEKSVSISKIRWETQALKLTDEGKFLHNFKEKLDDHPKIDCFAFIMKEGKIGLVIKGESQEKKEKRVYGILNTNAKDKQPEDLSFVAAEEECLSSFFSWGDKIIMISTKCDNGDGKVKRSADMTKWDDGVGSFYHLCDILKDKNDFTATTIGDNKKVLLFTEVKNNGQPAGKKEVNLWMSDGNHVKNVGVIVKDVVEKFPIRILFTEKELFSLYQKEKINGELKNILLARHEDLFKDINSSLDAWHSADKLVLTFCTELVNEKKLCEGNLPTDGVVSLLSAEGNDYKDWKDMYNDVSATVEERQKANAESTFVFGENSNGVKFIVDKSAKKLYDFTKYGFTIVTVVVIDDVPKDNDKYNLILGVGVNDGSSKKIKLLCTNDKRWAVSDGDKSAIKKTKAICKKENVYVVTITLAKKNIAVYIDWEILHDEEENKIEINEADKISYFYFGADITNPEKSSTFESHVTVRKIILYNRPFTGGEINKLKPILVEKNLPGSQPDKTDTKENSDEDSELSNFKDIQEKPVISLDTQITQENDETNKDVVEQSLSRSKESAVVVSVNIGVGVLFFIFGAFTLTGNYV